MKNKNPPRIYKDRHGVYWITAEGLLKFYRVKVVDSKKYFYRPKEFTTRD